MWARIAEILLGLWLFATPFVFATYRDGGTIAAAFDHLAGLAAVGLALLSFTKGLRWAHIAILGLAAVLVLPSYLTGFPAPPYIQNRIAIGLVLAIFAIIPNRANEVPASWQEFYRKANE